MKVTKNNRFKARQPSKAKYWCGCDRHLGGDAGKCRSCGESAKGIKERRPAPEIILE